MDERTDLMHHLTLAGAKLRLQQVQDEIAMLLSAFPELTGDAGHETPPADPSPTPRRRALSAAGRARIIEAQRKRWAAVRAKRSGRERMSAAARRAVSLRMKKYWAERRKQAL